MKTSTGNYRRGNERLEATTIMKKLKSVVSEIDRRKLENLLAEHQTVKGVAAYLGVPPVVVENLMVYFLIC